MNIADRQLAIWLFLLTFATYAYFHGGGGWNQNSQFDLTRAIVERHTFAIDAYARNTGDLSMDRGHVYANKAPGLSLLAVIPYAILHAIEDDPDNPRTLVLNQYVCTLFCVALLGALIPAMLYRIGRERGVSPGWAAAVALAIGLATPLFPDATLFITPVPSGALMLMALTLRRRALAGFAAGLATSMNYLCAPAVLLFALVPGHAGGLAGRDAGRRAGGDPAGQRPARLLAFFAGAAPPLIFLAIYQKICFGSFFRTPIATMDPRFVSRGAAFGIMEGPSLDALYGITISPYRGLFYFAPVLLMALAGFVFWFRASRERAELLAVIAISAVFLAFNVSFNGWEGGFGISARYLVPLIPLWGLAMLFSCGTDTLVCAGTGRSACATLFGVLATISFAINFAAAAVDPQPSATIPRPLTQYILPLLIHGHFSPAVPITPPWSAATFTGHTSVNRMTFDEAVVFARHPPGSDAAEWSSFNLGEAFFGPGDARSLIPIALLLLAGCAAIAWKARSIPLRPLPAEEHGE